MTRNFVVTITISSFFILAGCTSSSAPTDNIKEMHTKFREPSEYVSSSTLWHINGELTKEGIYEQITDAHRKDGFGGVAILPLTPAQMWNGKDILPGNNSGISE